MLIGSQFVSRVNAANQSVSVFCNVSLSFWHLCLYILGSLQGPANFYIPHKAQKGSFFTESNLQCCSYLHGKKILFLDYHSVYYIK